MTPEYLLHKSHFGVWRQWIWRSESVTVTRKKQLTWQRQSHVHGVRTRTNTKPSVLSANSFRQRTHGRISQGDSEPDGVDQPHWDPDSNPHLWDDWGSMNTDWTVNDINGKCFRAMMVLWPCFFKSPYSFELLNMTYGSIYWENEMMSGIYCNIVLRWVRRRS